jgi:rod shape determining protein RodA
MNMSLSSRQENMGLWDKITQLNLGLIFLVCLTACIGFLALYSAAGGSMSPWASKQMARFAVGFVMMIVIALIDIRWWQRLSYYAYAGGLVLLVIVEVMGAVGMGAQRWINLGFIQLQPSELMKIATIMMLAQYFHAKTLEDIRNVKNLIWPTLIVLMPVASARPRDILDDYDGGGRYLFYGRCFPLVVRHCHRFGVSVYSYCVVLLAS